MQKEKIKISIIGSHGIYANYGGFDFLVNKLCELKSNKIEYLVFNSRETPLKQKYPDGVEVKRIPLPASGILGVFYDFISILIGSFRSDVLLLLGAQGMPLAIVAKFFLRKRIVVNVDGIEWERPKFGKFAKFYLRFCYDLACDHADKVILDNAYFKENLPTKVIESNRYCISTYGAEIDKSLEINDEIREKFSFIEEKYFLSLGRPIADNNLYELCEIFSKLDLTLVLVSVLTRNSYGKKIIKDFSDKKNIHLINGLFIKNEMDLLRRSCFAYIHTHSLCGTAPSLVEAIHCDVPILSIDVPQNRHTLENMGHYFSNFDVLLNELQEKKINFANSIPDNKLKQKYTWKNIVSEYEDLYF